MDRSFDPGSDRVDSLAQVVGQLHAEPIAGRLAEVGAEMEVGFRGDAAPLVDDFVDTLVREPGIFREAVGGDPHRPKKLFPQEFAGMDVEVLFHSLVIIRDFHIVGVLAIPAEADSILVIDSDAVLTRPVAFERFQVISRWKTEFMKGGRGFELSEFSQSDFVD
jgi:hypothetical protein